MNDMLKAALIGGVSFGIASALPYIGWVNMICCALYIGGGVLAAYLFMKDLPPQPKAPYRDGAGVGFLAGVFGGVAAVIATHVAKALGYDPVAEMVGMLQEMNVTIKVDSIGFMMMTITMYAVFATLGGLVGVAIFHKKGVEAGG